MDVMNFVNYGYAIEHFVFGEDHGYSIMFVLFNRLSPVGYLFRAAGNRIHIFRTK